ncbi:MFS transporter [Sinomonas cyclohexanicum]|uniref:MFS transporter n=1 Tax=Sinomonas cyclohexanicum TaxID=322009 RepID=A0ABN6FG91_SINCY|nr:MFS transporter [Corynebacterium cyclohexanicum]BCT75061.1 MFS transporter [Corynebacterium cyclohexanicum]
MEPMESTLDPTTAAGSPRARTTAAAPAAGQLTPRDVRIATWICFFAWTFAVYDFVLFGNLLPVLAAEVGWAPSQSTAVNTWVTAGTALVAFAVGPLVDRIGRRKGILISVIGAAIASLLTAVAGWAVGIVGGIGVVLLILVRSAAGLGYAEQSVNAAYLNELFAHAYTDPAKARRRGLIYSLVQSGWPIGSVLAAASIYLLFPVGGWALCFIVAAFPAIFIVIAGRWLKESPQFEAHRHANTTGSPLAEAFRGESLRSTVVIGLSFLLNWVGVLVFAILGTSLLSAPDGKDIPFTNALVILVVSNATAFAGYVFHGWLGDRIGRRNTIALGWILCGASFTAMLLAPSGNFGVVVAFYSAGLFFLIGPFSALLFFNGESFPVRTRATGGSIINAGGQVGAIISSFLITLALGAGWTWSTAAFWIGCVPIFASGLLILAARNVNPRTVRQD